ncbi:MAG: VOC family protein [bacterium]|nr:VOC family protein [bacterium]
MSDTYNTFKPSGFHTMNSYLFVDEPEEFIKFLITGLEAIELNRTINENDGSIANSILQIGDSCFMVSQSSNSYPAMSSSFYLFTEMPDYLFKKAINAGATAELEPMDMSYQDRQGGVKDCAGNIWWISKRLVQRDYQD